MSLTEILEEVARLSPAEKAQVRPILSVELDGESVSTIRERQEQVLQIMLQKGMIRRIPPRQNVPRTFRPIPIKGKPLSETIIEERR